MAWTEAKPPLYAGQDTTAATSSYPTWGTARTLRGNVQMQVYDITVTGGTSICSPWTFNTATLQVRLTNAAGSPIGNWASIPKVWGTVSPWVSLGFVTPLQGVRLQTILTVNASCPVYRCDWRAYLRWDNTGL